MPLHQLGDAYRNPPISALAPLQRWSDLASVRVSILVRPSDRTVQRYGSQQAYSWFLASRRNGTQPLVSNVEYEFMALVTNVGLRPAARVQVGFYTSLGGRLEKLVDKPVVEPGGGTAVASMYYTPVATPGTLQVKVDPHNQVAEINEEDNSVYLNWIVVNGILQR